MRRILVIIALFVLVANQGMAQFDLVSRALGALQANKLTEAKAYIDSAYTDDRHANETRMWYYRGYIYKDLFKRDRATAEADGYRKESFLSFKRTLELDTAQEFTENVRKIIGYLTSTMYNDAATALENYDDKKALKYYKAYKKVMQEYQPRMDFRARDMQFKLVLASVYSKTYDEAEIKDSLLFEQIKGLYQDVLAIDSNNISANYNLGILFYNQAVGIIEQMDYDMQLVRLYEIQEQCINLFLSALPYMKKAYELNPTRKETLIGLSGIYFSLNDLEKSDAFKKELEDLGGEDVGPEEENDPGAIDPMPQQDQQTNTPNDTPDSQTPSEDVKEKKKDKKKSKKNKGED